MAADWFAERELESARAYVLSTDQVLLGALLRCGWRIQRWTFFLASEPFGKFDRYHPSSGLLL